MLTAQEQLQGTGHFEGIRTESQIPGNDAVTANGWVENQAQEAYCDYRQDFVPESSSVPGGKTDYSPTGTPTFAIVSGVGGWVSATLASDNAAMIAGFSADDNLWLPSDRYLKKASRVMFNDAITTAQFALMGVSGLIESGVNPGTLAGFIGAVFYLNASMVLRAKIEDGNGVSVDESLGITIDPDLPYWYLIERDNMGQWNFYWGGGEGFDGDLVYQSVAASFDADQLLQPLDVVGKSEGTTEPAIFVDCQKERMLRGPLASQL